MWVVAGRPSTTEKLGRTSRSTPELLLLCTLPGRGYGRAVFPAYICSGEAHASCAEVATADTRAGSAFFKLTGGKSGLGMGPINMNDCFHFAVFAPPHDLDSLWCRYVGHLLGESEGHGIK